MLVCIDDEGRGRGLRQGFAAAVAEAGDELWRNIACTSDITHHHICMYVTYACAQVHLSRACFALPMCASVCECFTLN